MTDVTPLSKDELYMRVQHNALSDLIWATIEAERSARLEAERERDEYLAMLVKDAKPVDEFIMGIRAKLNEEHD